MTMGWFSMFLMTLEKIQMFFQVDWEEYYSHYLVDLLGLDQVKMAIVVKMRMKQSNVANKIAN